MKWLIVGVVLIVFTVCGFAWLVMAGWADDELDRINGDDDGA